MGWMETDALKERERFVFDALHGSWTMTELCLRYGVSRKTGYKWMARFEEGGWAALEDQPRIARNCPHRVSDEVRSLLLEVKERFPTWGARKVLQYVQRRYQVERWPVESTVQNLFARHGLVTHRRRRRRPAHPGKPRARAKQANDVWTADFKGQFRLKNGELCYPLTVADLHSRYVLECRALPSTKGAPVKQAFERLFKKVGMPKVILTDNGVPFASQAVEGLSELNVWWMKLDIEHVRTEPGKPQQNGRHERMHRTLKAETTKPPASNMKAQQAKFNAWKTTYNYERPHEGINNDVPNDHWQPSERGFPEHLFEPDYPDHFEVRKVSDNGQFRFQCEHLFIAGPLRGEFIGLEEVDDGLWEILYFERSLGHYDERTKKVIT
jgi:putative transposase